MKNLLVAIDFSPITTVVMEQAARLAKALHAKLWVIHVTSAEVQTLLREAGPFTDFAPEFTSMPGDVQLARELSAEEIKREHTQLHALSSSLRKQGINAQALLLKGHAAQTIHEKAEELDADIIIIGSHGHGLLHKAFIGSVCESLEHYTNRNIMIVPVPKK